MAPWVDGDYLTPTNLNTKVPSFVSTNLGFFNVRDYGALGLGSSSSAIDDAAIKNAEAARRAAGNGVLWLPAGEYWLTASTPTSLWTIATPGKVLGAGFSRTTLRYAGGVSLATGSDFSLGSNQTSSRVAGLGIVNVLSNGVSLDGFTIDAQGLCNYAITFAQAVTQGHINVSIFSIKDKGLGGTHTPWSGLNYCSSASIPGQSLSNSSLTQGLLARGIAGTLFRPDCPIQDGTDSITSRAPVAALVFGGAAPIFEGAGGNSRTWTTGGAIVMGDNAYNAVIARLDSVGVINGAVVGGEANYYTLDLLAHDLGSTVLETYGTGASASYGFGATAPGFGEQQTLGQLYKSGAGAAFYWFNAVGSTTSEPSVFISAGTNDSQGRVFANALIEKRVTLSSGTTAPVVKYGTNFRTNNASLTTIAEFVSGYTGQRIVLHVLDANTVIADNANITLGFGRNQTAFNGQVFEFINQGANVWRCTNGPNGPYAQNAVGDVLFPQSSRFSSGSALRPSIAFSSESSLGWYASGTSTLALSYGTLNLRGGALSLRTTASSASASNFTQGEFYLCNVSATSAQLGFRSGNTVYVFNAVQASP